MTETIVGTVRAADLPRALRLVLHIGGDMEIRVTLAEDGTATLYPPGAELHESNAQYERDGLGEALLEETMDALNERERSGPGHVSYSTEAFIAHLNEQ